MKPNLGALKAKITAAPAMSRDPRAAARIVLGVLAVANIVAAVIAFRPWADSPQQLEQQSFEIRKQQTQRTTQIARLKLLTDKSEKARNEGDKFLASYFLTRRTAASTLVNELHTMAKNAGIKPKEHAFAFEQIEGSDVLAIGTISGNYEGTYADLIKYVNQIDRSPRFFIVESMGASPQQGNTGVLNIQMKVNVFVREEGVTPAELRAEVRQ